MAAKEEEPVVMSLPMIKVMVRVLRAITKLLIGEAMEGIEVPIMMDLLEV